MTGSLGSDPSSAPCEPGLVTLLCVCSLTFGLLTCKMQMIGEGDKSHGSSCRWNGMLGVNVLTKSPKSSV